MKALWANEYGSGWIAQSSVFVPHVAQVQKDAVSEAADSNSLPPSLDSCHVIGETFLVVGTGHIWIRGKEKNEFVNVNWLLLRPQLIFSHRVSILLLANYICKDIQIMYCQIKK